MQAARFGKQSIAQSSQTCGTSKEIEIKVSNVAHVSLDNLLIGYSHFLRTRARGMDGGPFFCPAIV